LTRNSRPIETNARIGNQARKFVATAWVAVLSTALREAGWRPIAVFASATVVNIGLALALASLLSANFTL
jgi:hypothetical protein